MRAQLPRPHACRHALPLLLALLASWATGSRALYGVSGLIQYTNEPLDKIKGNSQGVVVAFIKGRGPGMSFFSPLVFCWEPHWTGNNEARVICRELRFAGGCMEST